MPHIRTSDDAQEELGYDLADGYSAFIAGLSYGDWVKVDERAKPLKVVEGTFGSHAIVEGPQGAVYRLEYVPENDTEIDEGYRLRGSGGTTERVSNPVFVPPL